MMTFGECMRALMAERKMSLRSLAKTIHYDVGYLSKISRDLKSASAELADELDTALGADGALVALGPVGVPGTGDGEFFPTAELDPPGNEDIELIEIAQRTEGSDLGAGALEMIDAVVERLCRDYPTVPPAQLRTRGRSHLDNVVRLLEGRTTLAEHRELLVRAGWLSALLACAYYDFGDKAAAEVARRTTRRLGEQAGHGEVIAWSWEIAAWFALVERRYDDVVTYSEAGIRHAGATNAAVQLTLQAGRGYARMRDRRAVEALKVGRKILDQLPRPDRPDHHFVFDHDKYEFYCSTIYTMLGQDDAAEEHAREVVEQCQRNGPLRWPMRYAMVNLDLGLVAGRRGDLEAAVQHGRVALQPVRRSGDLLPRAIELGRQLAQRYPREPSVAEFADQLRHERRAQGPAGHHHALP
jgi:transcriptional regulator with XRE-family HTH domain